MYVCLNWCTYTMCVQELMEVRRDIIFPGTEFIDGCKPSHGC